jgi:hypothetical protein
LEGSWGECEALAPKFQYFVSEVVFLRLFSLLSEALEEIACKLVAGASYVNGTAPEVLHKTNSVQSAKSAMLTVGRRRSRRWLNFTNAREIELCVRHVIDSNDSFLRMCFAHDPIIDEMRIVRNYIAHRNSGTFQNYGRIIRRTYGANSKIQPGPFLVSKSRESRSKLESYLISSRIVLHDLVTG